MDFGDTPQDAIYREKVRAWLSANAAILANPDPIETGRAWQAAKASAGYACITWPSEWGGPGGTMVEQIIFREEEAAIKSSDDIFMIGLGMCLPTVMAYASDQTKLRFAGPALRGEEIWCQLFSEPGAGSDLAAVRTRATRSSDGRDDWIIDGQKMWTSMAHVADYGLILCRTNPKLPKHKGLTMFWLDMRSAGVEISPIVRMNGNPGFSSVFLSEVRIPDGQRLGEIDGGWAVAITTLMNERYAVGGGGGAGWRELLTLAIEHDTGAAADLIRDGQFRSQLSEFYLSAEGLRHTRNRTITALSKGELPGPENSIGKLVSASLLMNLTRTFIDALGPFGLIDDPAISPRGGEIHRLFMTSPGHRIAGGTDEIMKNIIAERVLGLPAEPQTDRNRPFEELGL